MTPWRVALVLLFTYQGKLACAICGTTTHSRTPSSASRLRRAPHLRLSKPHISRCAEFVLWSQQPCTSARAWHPCYVRGRASRVLAQEAAQLPASSDNCLAIFFLSGCAAMVSLSLVMQFAPRLTDVGGGCYILHEVQRHVLAKQQHA